MSEPRYSKSTTGREVETAEIAKTEIAEDLSVKAYRMFSSTRSCGGI